MRRVLLRLLVAGSVLVVWLAFLSSRQTALYPTVAQPAVELVPIPLAFGAIIVAFVGRLLAWSTSVAVVWMAVLSCGAALVAAQLGAPLSNASDGVVGGDYCGDFCRSAIMGRFISFFGWPLLTASGLILLGRRDRLVAGGGAEHAAWTRAWAAATLVLGLLASAVWWRVILPEG
jgi:hypothetical protein